MKEKIIFMGTPDFAACILERLIKEGYNITCVVTQPDKPFGRKQEVKYSPVKQVALDNNLEIFQPLKIKEDFKQIQTLSPDLIITAAYGQIVPIEVLKAPRIKCVNIHGSLLPKYRGGAPIHYAVINGEPTTGVTIMEMVEKMDAGGIITTAKFPIEFTDTVGDVYNKMKYVGADLIIKTLPSLLNNNFTITPQVEEEVTFSPNIKPEEERLDFSKTTLEVYNHIRGMNPFPVAYFEFNEKRYKVYKSEILNDSSVTGMIMDITKLGIDIGCSDGIIRILELQPAGKKKLTTKDYINGKIDLEINKICN